MKKILFVFLLFTISIFSVEKPYYHLEGKIGNNDITMEINVFEKNSVTIFYNFNKIGEVISLIGNIDKNKIIASKDQESFSGVLINGKFEGTWKKGNTVSSFSLIENYKDCFTLDELKNLNMSPLFLSTADENYIRGTSVVYNKGDFVSIEDYSYVYSGGAHGNYGVNYRSYDKISKKIIAYSDFFDFEANEILESLLAKEIKSKNIKTFGTDFFVTDNIYFTEKGITFVYNPYEIASYADGIISVFLPFEKIPKSIILKNEITKRIMK